MDALRYYIDGPGEVLVVATDFDQAHPCADKILASISCKGVNIQGDADMEDVTGGRSLFPKRRFQTGRSASVEITDCEMDFRYAAMTSGELIEKGAVPITAFGSDFRYEVPSVAPFEITLPETPIPDTMTVRFTESGTVAAPGTAVGFEKYTLEGNKLTFAEADKGKLVECLFSYLSPEDTLYISQKVDSLPKAVKVIHKQPTFDGDNNITGYQYVVFFKMQPSPAFAEDYQERAAYSPSITFNLIDPQRTDKKIMDRYWVRVAHGSESHSCNGTAGHTSSDATSKLDDLADGVKAEVSEDASSGITTIRLSGQNVTPGIPANLVDTFVSPDVTADDQRHLTTMTIKGLIPAGTSTVSQSNDALKVYRSESPLNVGFKTKQYTLAEAGDYSILINDSGRPITIDVDANGTRTSYVILPTVTFA